MVFPLGFFLNALYFFKSRFHSKTEWKKRKFPVELPPPHTLNTKAEIRRQAGYPGPASGGQGPLSGVEMLSADVSSALCSVAPSRPALCYPVDWSPPGSSVLGGLQARVLEQFHSFLQGTFPSRGSSVSHIGRRALCHWHHLRLSGK